MKQTVGSGNIQAAPHDQPRTARRVSGTVRVSNVSKTSAQHSSPEVTTDNDTGAAYSERVPAQRAETGAEVVASAVVASHTTVSERLSSPVMVAGAIVATTIAAHFALPTGWLQLVVPLAPLSFALIAPHDNRRMQWAVYAGLFWFMLAWAELVHPMAGARAAIYRLVELTVLGAILVQLYEGARFMQHLSQRDPLTGLLNRRGFEELSSVELKRAARHDRPIAFALLDVDRFKAVNDQYGHSVGDRVLRIVSEELLKLRTSDLAVRLGGDEFGLLMPETDEAGAEQLIARLRQRIHLRMFEQGWPVTISAGVATSEQCRRRLPDLMAEADKRMYVCKVAERG
jgi:diguanylate cyclase (GGDEF)-like protein